MAKRKIDPSDILPIDVYIAQRKDIRAQRVAVRKARRLLVGPFASLHFESFQTMFWQVQEMLYIERGGEEQLREELAAYNPMIPNGRELTATIMFEIDEPQQRKSFLSKVGNIERTLSLQFADQTIMAVPEEDTERTNESGKASSVHFVHFPFTSVQIDLFRLNAQRVTVGFSHPEYPHMTIMPDAMRTLLAADFD